MEKYAHGGDIYSREIKLDFSANINPLGLPDVIRKAATSADFEHYPDPECTAVSKALSEYESVTCESIVCANGAADLIYRIVRTLSAKHALLAAPTFSEYEKSLSECGCEVDLHYLREESDFELQEDFSEKLTPDIDVVFICNPNNPVGNVVSQKLLLEMFDKCEKNHTTVIVDECFLDFTEIVSAKRYIRPNVIILKAFTKSCCMAGLRLGYGIFGDKRLAAEVKKCGQPWSVSAPAQAAGEAAAKLLLQTNFLSLTRHTVQTERKYLAAELSQRGFKVFPSQANFLLVKYKEDFADRLLQKKIAVRSCENYHGLSKEFFRIAVRTHDENTQLIEAIDELY